MGMWQRGWEVGTHGIVMGLFHGREMESKGWNQEYEVRLIGNKFPLMMSSHFDSVRGVGRQHHIRIQAEAVERTLKIQVCGWAGFLVTLGCYNKISRLGGFNNKYLFLSVWRLRSPRSRSWQIQLQVRALFLTCRCLILHSFCLAMSSHVGEREHSGLSSSSYKDTNPIMRVPPSWPHLNLITSQRPHLYHHIGV